MKLYTSYFAQLRNFPPNLIALSTAKFSPKWLQPGRDKNGAIWLVCPPLQPGHTCEGLCNGECNPKHPQDCEFLKAYRKQLDAIDFNKFMENLNRLAKEIKINENLDDVNFALLVYETPQNQCSERNVLQQWLRDNGINVEEWHK